MASMTAARLAKGGIRGAGRALSVGMTTTTGLRLTEDERREQHSGTGR